MKLFNKELKITLLSKIFLIVALSIHLLFILSLIFGFLNPPFHDSTYRLGQAADFYAFYQAGYNILFGLNPYNKVAGYNIVPYSYNYRYLPFFAYTFGLAFNIFPPVVAYWIWAIIIIFLIWYTCWITLKICNTLNKPKWVAYIALGMWLCFSPIYLELYMGQTTLFVGLLTFFSFYAEYKKKEKTGIILWTLGSLVKYMPYLLTPAILCSGRTRKVIYNILLSMLAIISFGLVFFIYFLNYNLDAAGNLFTHNGNFDLKNLLYLFGRIFTQDENWFLNNNRLVNIILISSFFGISILATIYTKDYLIAASLFACSYFLAFSGIWEHHFTFILPFLVVLWIRGDNRKWWFLIFILLALPTPFYFFELFNLWNLPFSIIYKSSKTIPMLILFILLLIKAYKNPRQENYIDSLKRVSNLIYIGLKEPNIEELSNIFILTSD